MIPDASMPAHAPAQSTSIECEGRRDRTGRAALLLLQLRTRTLAGLLFCASTAWAGGEPFSRERLIFPLQPKHVHSSCIVECPNGDLLACWFQGSGERRATDVAVMGARLRRGTEAWSATILDENELVL